MTARLDILHTARDGVFSRDVRSGKRELTIYHLQAPIYREIDANQPNSTLTPSTKAELQDFKTSRLQDFKTSRLPDFPTSRLQRPLLAGENIIHRLPRADHTRPLTLDQYLHGQRSGVVV